MSDEKKFYGQFDPPVDKVIHERYFPDKYGGTSLEAGAFDGQYENNTKFFEENYNWKTINIEPLPHIFRQLKINRPDSINLNIALSDSNAEKEITVYDIPKYGINNTNASINHTDKHEKLLQKMSGDKKKTFSIICKTYTELIKELEVDHLDLFVLDVEGHEPEVIDGMANCEVLPDVFVIEHGHREPQFFVEKLKILKAKYKLDFTSHVNSFFVKV